MQNELFYGLVPTLLQRLYLISPAASNHSQYAPNSRCTFF